MWTAGQTYTNINVLECSIHIHLYMEMYNSHTSMHENGAVNTSMHANVAVNTSMHAHVAVNTSMHANTAVNTSMHANVAVNYIHAWECSSQYIHACKCSSQYMQMYYTHTLMHGNVPFTHPCMRMVLSTLKLFHANISLYMISEYWTNPGPQIYHHSDFKLY